ncbi:MAG: hypothetical protein AABO41_22595 [Acidobacteriota bacterium]
MRILHTSVVTFLIISLATIASAQGNGLIPGFIPNGTTVAAPPADAPKIDPSKVRFLLAGSCDERMILDNPTQGRGIVAPEIDLRDELIARQLLQMGITFVLEKCPSAKRPYVYLRSGGPAAFTDAREGFGFVGRTIYERPLDVVQGGGSNERPGLIVDYLNFPRAYVNQQAYYAEQERQRKAALEQKRQAEQKTAARWAAFLKTNRVKHIVTIDQLTANPFVYQGQVVAVRGSFQRMNSATQGVFSGFVVSGISTARFTRSGSSVVLAGRVLGNIEVKPGPMLVPHLSFIGVWTD